MQRLSWTRWPNPLHLRDLPQLDEALDRLQKNNEGKLARGLGALLKKRRQKAPARPLLRAQRYSNCNSWYRWWAGLHFAPQCPNHQHRALSCRDICGSGGVLTFTQVGARTTV